MLKQIYTETWRVYKRNFWNYVLISLVPLCFIALGVLLYRASYFLGGIFILLGGFFGLFSWPAMLYVSKSEQRIKFARGYLLGIENVFSFTWVALESLFAAIPDALIAAVILLLPMYLFEKVAPTFSVNHFTPAFLVYESIILVAGIYYFTKVILATFVLAEEGSRGVDALAKSIYYTKDWWWRLVGAILSLVIPFIGISYLFYQLSINHELASEVLSAAFYLLATPFSIAFVLSIYRHIRSRKGTAPEPAPKQKWKLFFRVLVGMAVALYLYLG